MKKLTKILSCASIAATMVMANGMAATAAPIAAPATSVSTIGSVMTTDAMWDLCMGLPTEAGRTDCLADRIVDTRATAAELRCYTAAGVVAVETVAGTLITPKDSLTIAGAAGVPAVFTCIKSFV